jgi:hypothetical protein
VPGYGFEGRGYIPSRDRDFSLPHQVHVKPEASPSVLYGTHVGLIDHESHGTRNQDDCSGEGQQQFTGLHWAGLE